MNSVQEIQTQLLTDLQAVCARIGRAPTGAEFTKFGLRPASFYRYQFGSITEALKLIGVRGNKTGVRIARNTQFGPPPKYTRRVAINHVRRIAKELGRTPTQKDLLVHAPPYPHTLVKQFDGKLFNLMKAAGLEARRGPRERGYTEQQLVDHLRQLEWKLGRKPTFTDVKKSGPPNVHTGLRYFGSFEKWLLAAGYPIRRAASQRGNNDGYQG
jgi:hypothetical protein